MNLLSEILLIAVAQDAAIEPEGGDLLSLMRESLEARGGDRVAWSVEPDWPGDPNRPYVSFLQRVPIPASVIKAE